ncbi:hypothetical protein HDK77DRAFT_447703 [Phyllosticta capitalensis]|uniref:uncharacterized protein n=1 Tax=Phyllosticta capitalensis TaxID=121624 RepID=UPI00312D4C54
MFSFDISTRAQALTLKTLGVPEAEIRKNTGISPRFLGLLEKRAIEGGWDPVTSPAFEDKHLTFTNSPDQLPVELQLNIVSFLDLKSLIRMQSISRHWRALIKKHVHSPQVVHPARCALLQLYNDWVVSDSCRVTRETVLPNLRNFDRDEYLENFPANVPSDFEMWVREWPAAAVIGWLWPGLPPRPPNDDGEDMYWDWGNHLNRLSEDCLELWRDPYRSWVYCRMDFGSDSPYADDIKKYGAAHGWRWSGETSDPSLIRLETRAIEIQTGLTEDFTEDGPWSPSQGIVLYIISGAGPFNGTIHSMCGHSRPYPSGRIDEFWIPEVNCDRPENRCTKGWVHWLRKHMEFIFRNHGWDP